MRGRRGATGWRRRGGAGGAGGGASGCGGGGLRDSIRRRPLTWFFVLANLLSWVAWTPYILSENGLGVLHFRFPEVFGTAQFAGVLPGAYLGPIGAAFLVTAIADGRAGLRRWTARLLKWRVNWRWYVAVVLSMPARSATGTG